MKLAYSPITFQKKLLTTDLDGTILIPEKGQDHSKMSIKEREYNVQSFVNAFDAAKQNNIDNILIATGRNFTELSEIKDLLQKTNAPINAISLEDGKRLLTKPTSLTSQQWLAQLFGGRVNYMSYSDVGWQKENSKPHQEIARYLIELGFFHRKDNNETLIFDKPIKSNDVGVKKMIGEPRWRVEIMPPGVVLKVHVIGGEESDIDIEAYNKSINSEILELLKAKGYKIDTCESKKEISFVNTFPRKDINKKTVADYYKSILEKGTQEIRAGNSWNDVEMLEDKTIIPIVVGNDEHLQNIQRAIRVQEGNLAEGINQGAKLICNA